MFILYLIDLSMIYGIIHTSQLIQDTNQFLSLPTYHTLTAVISF